MMPETASLYVRARAAMPLAVLLLFLNTARSVQGVIDARALLCGLSFWFLVQLSYVYDSLFRTLEDKLNLPGVPEGSGRTWPVFAAAAVPAAYIAWLGFWPMIVVAFLVIPFYSNPSLSPRRLKTIPVVKSLVSVLNFWLVGVVVPVLLSHDFSGGLLLELLRSSAVLLFFVFLLTVLLDVRDAEGDREAGVVTIPVLLGARNTALAIAFLLFAAAFHLFRQGQVPAAGLALMVSLFSLFAAGERGRSYYEWMLASVNAALAVKLLLAV